MVHTLIGPRVFEYPYRRSHAFVYVKKNWFDDWELIDDLIFLSGQGMPAGRGLGRCEFRHRYGRKIEGWWSDYSTDPSIRYEGYWIMARLTADQNSMEELWYGRVYGDLRDVHGSDAGESGKQVLTAYEPLQELRMEPINVSYFIDQGDLKEIGWVPGFNSRDEHNMLVGNSTTTKVNGSFHFGGDSIWTRYDIIEYLFANYLPLDGPKWTIDGQTEILKNMRDTINVRSGSTIADVLTTLIPRTLGYDYDIVPYYGPDDGIVKDNILGFTLHVFSLSPDDITFGGYTLKGNKNILRLDMETKEIEARKFEKGIEMKYNAFRICGERMTVCKSLYGETQENDTPRTNFDITGKWTDSVEENYEKPGGSSATNNDDLRGEQRYNNVYSAIGAVETWGFPGPILDNEGNVTGTGASYQTTIRETLTVLPLREGYDYTINPAINNNPSNYTADFLKPMAFIYDEENSKWMAAEKHQIGITTEAMQHDWGLYLRTKYNHVLAKNSWALDSEATLKKPLLDYKKVCMTIAFKTDHKLCIHKEMDTDGEKTLEVTVPGAELWYLDADTILDVIDGSLQTTSVEGRVLRNDADRLKPWMCGTEAWYQSTRVRGDITVQAWQPWRYMLGQFLQPFSQGNDILEWKAPFTSIEWTEDGKTILRVGYA